MNDNAKAWLAALRSDEFKQARGRLKTNDGHCCLGVACVLAECAGVKNAWPATVTYTDVLCTSYLPGEVATWLGIRNENEFASLNDKGSSFAEIANYAEEHAAEYFTS